MRGTRDWVWLSALLMLAVGSPLTKAADRPPAGSAVSDFVPDPASVVREGAGYRYTQSGWIVVHIEGEPYERGYQHGKLLAAEIVDNIKASATARSPKAPNDAWRDLRTLSAALFLRRYDVEYLEEMKGIADGASAAGAKFDGRPLDLQDIVAVNSWIEATVLESGLAATSTGLEDKEFREPPEGTIHPEGEEHCSAFAATGPATGDGQIVFGHITMFSLYLVRHFNVWLDIQPKAGHRLVMQTNPGGIMSGLDYYMNDTGLLCCETTIAQTGFHAEGTPVASRIRRVMQYADSIDKAVEILRSSNNGLYTNEWLLADTKTGEIAAFELGTQAHKLWRSSQGDFPGGTAGFYWGCNNAKDIELRKETVPSLSAKPANLVFCPRSRDVRWQQLFEEHKGKIDVAFGFKAFTTPPIAAFTSCDAKFTTTALAKDLKSWALFGPPRGRTWDATPEESRRLPDIKPLVSNDWALIGVNAPAARPAELAKTVDLVPFPKERDEPGALAEQRTDQSRRLPPAWRGSLLPAADEDLWLAAAFADYERIVALEKSLRKKAKDGALDKDARDRLDVALFAPESRWLASARRLGHDLPLGQIRSEWDTNEWYGIAAGKGVMLLAALRSALGGDVFDKALDAFGRANAGKAVTTRQLREHLEQAAGRPLGAIFDPWTSGNGTLDRALGNFWSIDSFETEPEQAIIVYGTLEDRDAQREAAALLSRKIERRGSNYSVPFKSDIEVTDDELKNHHVLLVGRPGANMATAKLADGLSIRFGPGSLTVRGETYGHADSAIVAAGQNRLNPRYSIVVYAGLGARATRECVERLSNRGGEPTEVLLMPAGRSTKALRIAAQAAAKPDQAAANSN